MRLTKIITPRILNNYSTNPNPNPNPNICVLLFFSFFFFINSTVTMGRADLKFSTLDISIGNTRKCQLSCETLGTHGFFWKISKLWKFPLLGPLKKKSEKIISFFFSNFFYSFLNFLGNQIERGNTVAALFSERKPRFLSSP